MKYFFYPHLQQEIGVEINVENGSLGCNYQNILIVDENGRIKKIGEYLYHTWDKYSNSKHTIDAITELGKQAEKYRLGLRSKMPVLYRGIGTDGWCITDDNTGQLSPEQKLEKFKARGGSIHTAFHFPNGNIVVLDENIDDVPLWLNWSKEMTLEEKVKELRKSATHLTRWIGFATFMFTDPETHLEIKMP